MEWTIIGIIFILWIISKLPETPEPTLSEVNFKEEEYNPSFILQIDSKTKQKYLNSNKWKDKRLQALKRDNYTCQSCGSLATEVHHLHYRFFENEPLNELTSLCRECHQKVHEKHGYFNIKDDYPLYT